MITRSFLKKKIRCQEKNSGTAGPTGPDKYQLCNIMTRCNWEKFSAGYITPTQRIAPLLILLLVIFG